MKGKLSLNIYILNNLIWLFQTFLSKLFNFIFKLNLKIIYSLQSFKKKCRIVVK
jgi:hypothetical protein